MNRQQRTPVTPVNDYEITEAKQLSFADSLIPTMDEKTGLEYVPFGYDNTYPDYLMMLYNKSAKHNAIINGKVVYIMGKGLVATDDIGNEFLKRANEKQSWDQLMKVAALDIENFGGCYFQVIPKLGGGYNIYHISYDKIRSDEYNSKFFYKKKWQNSWSQCDKTFPAFYPGIEEPSIYMFKEYRCGKTVYPLPQWVSACNWIESDVEVSKHTLTNSKTGFSASKFINFYNGEPAEEKKQRIQRRLENAATGAEGKKILIGFNNDPSKKPTVDDLGTSDLTKEDFTNIDNLITNNIFTGHNITHPLLFGIQQEGKLGNATELKTAYDIFKQTYVLSKQIQIEDIVTYFSNDVFGLNSEYDIIDVEPVGIEIDPVQFKELLPKEWVFEKLGIDISKYEVETVNNEPSTQQMGNEALVKLSGRQQQNLLRIVRLFSQNKLTKQQAAIQLSAYGFTPEQIDQYLGVDNDPMTNDQQFSDDEDNRIADMFSEIGFNRNEYIVIGSKLYNGDDDDVQFAVSKFYDYTDNEAKVLELLKANPDLTNQQVAEALKLNQSTVDGIVERMVKIGIIVEAAKKGGGIIKKITEKLPPKQLPEFVAMYTYEKRDGVPGPTLLRTSRPFCRRMVTLSESRMWSREQIQNLSDLLGYSVFTRAGGFWNNNGKIEYHCRHAWVKHIVIKKES